MSGIVIHRSHHAQQYVVIPNAIARDKRLSFRARGLLVMLLSLPLEWHVTTAMLAEDNPEGRDTIRRALHELCEVGYVQVHREQGPKGHWRTRMEVFDQVPPKTGRPVPGATSENDVSAQVAPKTEKPDFGEPGRRKKYKTSSRAKTTRGEAAKTRPPWCGQCDENSRLTDEDNPRRCPACHPLAVS